MKIIFFIFLFVFLVNSQFEEQTDFVWGWNREQSFQILGSEEEEAVKISDLATSIPADEGLPISTLTLSDGNILFYGRFQYVGETRTGSMTIYDPVAQTFKVGGRNLHVYFKTNKIKQGVIGTVSLSVYEMYGRSILITGKDVLLGDPLEQTLKGTPLANNFGLCDISTESLSCFQGVWENLPFDDATANLLHTYKPKLTIETNYSAIGLFTINPTPTFFKFSYNLIQFSEHQTMSLKQILSFYVEASKYSNYSDAPFSNLDFLDNPNLLFGISIAPFNFWDGEPCDHNDYGLVPGVIAYHIKEACWSQFGQFWDFKPQEAHSYICNFFEEILICVIHGRPVHYQTGKKTLWYFSRKYGLFDATFDLEFNLDTESLRSLFYYKHEIYYFHTLGIISKLNLTSRAWEEQDFKLNCGSTEDAIFSGFSQNLKEITFLCQSSKNFTLQNLFIWDFETKEQRNIYNKYLELGVNLPVDNIFNLGSTLAAVTTNAGVSALQTLSLSKNSSWVTQSSSSKLKCVANFGNTNIWCLTNSESFLIDLHLSKTLNPWKDFLYSNVTVFHFLNSEYAALVTGASIKIGNILNSTFEDLPNFSFIDPMKYSALMINSKYELFIGGQFLITIENKFEYQNIAKFDMLEKKWLPIVKIQTDKGRVLVFQMIQNLLYIGGNFRFEIGSPPVQVGNILALNENGTLHNTVADGVEEAVHYISFFLNENKKVDEQVQIYVVTKTNQNKYQLFYVDGISPKAVPVPKSNWVTRMSAGVSPNSWGPLFWTLLSLSIVVVASIFLAALYFYFRRKRRYQYLNLPEISEELSTNYKNMALSISDLLAEYNILQIFEEDVELIEILGRGAQGEVSKCFWNSQIVAAKKVFNANNFEILKQIFQEIFLLNKLNNQHILKFYGVMLPDTDDPALRNNPVNNYITIITEIMQHDLATVKHKLKQPHKLQIIQDIANGMKHLHRSIPPVLHRDLKPSNILLSDKGKCKIADFGVSRLQSESEAFTMRIGTPAYMAPEVFLKGDKNYGPGADVYSFGVLVSELYGKNPYEHVEFGMLNEFVKQFEQGLIQPQFPNLQDNNCPDFIQQLIKDCCQTNEKERPTFKNICKYLSNAKKLKENQELFSNSFVSSPRKNSVEKFAKLIN